MRSDTPGESIAMTRAALAMCENIDWNVGRVLTRLERAEARRQTQSFCISATTDQIAGVGMAG